MNKMLLENRIFRKAEISDVEEIWTILLQAKAQMRALGSCQWDENYPSEELVREDIAAGDGYVAQDAESGRVLAYGVVSFEGEPIYDQIYDLWDNNLPYIVVHRLAVSDLCKHQGVARWFMNEAEEVARACGVYNFRVDTKYDNHYMLSLIDRMGFHYVGEVEYRGSEYRKAFEKAIVPKVEAVLPSGFTLREVTLADAAVIYEAIDSHREDLRTWLAFVDQVQRLDDEEEYLLSILSAPREEKNEIYLIESEQRFCGLVGIALSDPLNHRAELGYWLLPEYRGRGVMKEALGWLTGHLFEKRDFHRLQLRCATNNLPSNTVAVQSGFLLEGVERESELLVTGRYVDMNVYSLLENDL